MCVDILMVLLKNHGKGRTESNRNSNGRNSRAIDFNKCEVRKLQRKRRSQLMRILAESIVSQSLICGLSVKDAEGCFPGPLEVCGIAHLRHSR